MQRLPHLRGIHLAQVVEVHPAAPETTGPDEPPYAGTLDVLLADTTPIGDPKRTFRVRMLRPRAHPSAGSYRLPEPGDWGLVAFYANDARAGVWVGSLDDQLRNMIPEELWAQDPYAELEHKPSDRYAIYHGDGTEEHVWPDGSYLKITTRKDGTPSNTSYRERLTRRRVRRKDGGFASHREDYTPHAEPPADVVFVHSSGAKIVLTADGSFELTTPKGHRLKLFDATEKARDPESGAVIAEATPDRAPSAVVLESEVGHRIELHDDPVNAANRYVRVQTAGGHVLELRDKPNAEAGFSLRSASGHTIEGRDQPQTLTVRDITGSTLVFSPNGVTLTVQGNLTMTATGTVTIDGSTINIG